MLRFYLKRDVGFIGRRERRGRVVFLNGMSVFKGFGFICFELSVVRKGKSFWYIRGY